MLIHYDYLHLQSALTDFYNATGVNVCLLDAEGQSIFRASENGGYCRWIQGTEHGKEACNRSDTALLEKCKKSLSAEIHVCHAGLADVALPILHEEKILAYIILGQMRLEEGLTASKEYLEALGLDYKEMRGHYESIPRFTEERVRSIAAVAGMLGKHLLLEHVFQMSRGKTIEEATRYIAEHLEEPLSVISIAKGIHISKSVLYKSFRAALGCTVKEYVNDKRLERSLRFLLETEASMEEISRKVGFTSAAYYTKLFKARHGMPPLRFRREHS